MVIVGAGEIKCNNFFFVKQAISNISFLLVVLQCIAPCNAMHQYIALSQPRGLRSCFDCAVNAYKSQPKQIERTLRLNWILPVRVNVRVLCA